MTSRLNFYKSSLSPSKENTRSIDQPVSPNSTHIKLTNSLSTAHISLSEGNGNKEGNKIQFNKERYQHCKENTQLDYSKNIGSTHIDLSQRSVLSNIDLVSKKQNISSPFGPKI